MDRLSREFRDQGRQELFQLLRPHFYGETGASRYEEIAQATGMTVTAVKSSMHRLRSRYRAVLRDEIARSLSNQALVEDELDALSAILAESSGVINQGE